MKVNKLILSFLCAISLFVASCSHNNDDEPEIYPIRFEQSSYTIRFGVGTSISFVDGGGIYELTASNPEVLGKFGIDSETHRLLINPSSVGESSLAITDILANTTVTLNFTVEDFYLSFKVDEINGKNINPYLSIDDEIRFIRDGNNTRRIKICRSNDGEYVADGVFEIERSETNIFTLDMALHRRPTEELEVFSYTMGGDGEYLNLFDKYFEYNWDKSIVSKSLPVKRINMILTDSFNDCKISCSLQPF